MLDTSGSQMIAAVLWELLKLFTLGFVTMAMLFAAIGMAEQTLRRIGRFNPASQPGKAARPGGSARGS